MNHLTKRVLALAFTGALSASYCLGQELDGRPVKPTDAIPTWKEAVDLSYKSNLYPGWTPPPIMITPFTPPQKEAPPEEQVCITVEEARELVRIIQLATLQAKELEATTSALYTANNRINFLELRVYEVEYNFKELQKAYIKQQEELRRAEKLIEELAPK